MILVCTPSLREELEVDFDVMQIPLFFLDSRNAGVSSTIDNGLNTPTKIATGMLPIVIFFWSISRLSNGRLRFFFNPFSYCSFFKFTNNFHKLWYEIDNTNQYVLNSPTLLRPRHSYFGRSILATSSASTITASSQVVLTSYNLNLVLPTDTGE